MRISGDAEVAENFQALFGFVRPDPEEELAKVTGDVVAHEVGNIARGVMGFLGNSRDSLGRSVAEYLTEESRAVVNRTEHDEFCAAVDELSLATERLEAKVRILREGTDVS